MALSFNLSTYVITIPQADLTFVSGTSWRLDTTAFRIALKDWEDNEEGIAQPKTHNHNTSVLLGGIEYARVIEILSPWTITFQETGTPYSVALVGSNNNILDSANLGTVQILSNNSAGLINVPEVQVGAFDDGVSINALSSYLGTNYPVGTQFAPVNNIADALTIANGRGFKNLYITGSINLESGTDVRNFVVQGIGATLNVARTTITMIQGCLTSNSNFKYARITGYQGGETVYDNCIIDGIENAHCVFTDCGIKDGTTRGWSIKQSAGLSSTHASFFRNCYSDAGQAIIDRNGSAINVGFSDFFGNLKIINQTSATGAVWINMKAGAVIIDSSCTTGTIYISGNCAVIDNSNGTLVDTSQVTAGWDALAADHNKPNTMGARLNSASAGGVDYPSLAGAVWNAQAADYNTAGTLGDQLGNISTTAIDYDQIATAVWTRPIEATFSAEQILKIAAAVLAGRVSGAGTGTETFTGLDGSTIRVVSTNDAVGNRTSVLHDGV